MKTLLHLGFILLLSLPAFGRGGESGGGGAYVLVNGEMKISDLYFKSVPARTTEEGIKAVGFHQFPPAVLRATRHLLQFAESKLKLSVTKLVADVGAVYFLLPLGKEHLAICPQLYVADVSRPVEANLQFGCTNGNVTYLFVDVFERADLREQAYGILHERLWTVKPDISHAEVATINAGIHTVEDVHLRQEAGDLAPLSGDEKSVINEMTKLADALGLSRVKGLEASDHGGLIKNSCLSPLSRDYIIGAGSLIDCTTKKLLLRNSKILSSSLSDQFMIKNSEIVGSSLEGMPDVPSSQAEGVKIKDSILVTNLSVSGPATITGSQVSGVRQLKLHPGSSLTNFTAKDRTMIELRANASLKDVLLRLTDLPHVVEEHTSLEKMRLDTSGKSDECPTRSEKEIVLGHLKKASGSERDGTGREFDFKVPCGFKLQTSKYPTN